MVTPTEQWNRIIDVQLAAMGGAPLQAGPDSCVMHMVVFSAFHSPCCFMIDDMQTTIELSLVILQNQARVDEHINQAHPVWSDIVELPFIHYQPLREQMARLEPQDLTDDVRQTRDGVILRCQFLHAGAVHSRWMLNPRCSSPPDDLRLIQTLVMLARDAFQDSDAQFYLAQLYHWYFRS